MLANNKKSKESHPFTEALRDFGLLAIFIGMLAVGLEVAVD